MSKKWVDESITTRANRTPEQRERDMRDAETDTVKLNEAGLTLLERRIAEQNAIITGQRAAIEALREMVEDVAQGHRHLAGRLDALAHLLDSQAKSVAERFGNVEATTGLLVDGYKQTVESLALRQELDKFKARVIAAVPSAGKPTMQKMCDDVEFRGPPEEDNDG